MASETVTPLQAPSSTDPMESIKAGLGTGFGAWRAFAVDLPLRIATETVRFTGCRLQAQADHLARSPDAARSRMRSSFRRRS